MADFSSWRRANRRLPRYRTFSLRLSTPRKWCKQNTSPITSSNPTRAPANSSRTAHHNHNKISTVAPTLAPSSRCNRPTKRLTWLPTLRLHLRPSKLGHPNRLHPPVVDSARIASRYPTWTTSHRSNNHKHLSKKSRWPNRSRSRTSSTRQPWISMTNDEAAGCQTFCVSDGWVDRKAKILLGLIYGLDLLRKNKSFKSSNWLSSWLARNTQRNPIDSQAQKGLKRLIVPVRASG